MDQLEMDKQIEYIDRELKEIAAQVQAKSEADLKAYWVEKRYVREARWRKYSPLLVLLTVTTVCWLAGVGAVTVWGWAFGY